MKSIQYSLSILLLAITATLSTATDYPDSNELATDFYRPDHVTPARLKAIVSPLYRDNSFFSVDDRQLVIRAKQPILNEILSLLPQLDHATRVFTVTLSDRSEPSKRVKSYSTKRQTDIPLSFSMSENSSITLIREQQRQQIGALSPLWIRVDNVPDNGEYLVLDLQSAHDHVYITIQWQSLRNGQLQSTNRRINGPLGQWITLGAMESAAATTTYRTASAGSRLPSFIKVEPAK